MSGFVIILSILIIIGGIVLGVLASKCDDSTFTDKDIQNFVFRNAFMNQLHDNFGLKK